MNETSKKSRRTWTSVKTELIGLDRLGLLDLIHDLYTLNKDNQLFLHTRFTRDSDSLRPYKKTLQRWLTPDVVRNQDVSVSAAKQAISDYKKAIGDSAGLAELMVFYCECAASFCMDVGMDDGGYLGALIRMFESALRASRELPAADRSLLVARLTHVGSVCDVGYGIRDTMEELLAEDDAE